MRFFVWFVVIYLEFIISCSCIFFLYLSDFCATCSTCIVFWPVLYCPASNFPFMFCIHVTPNISSRLQIDGVDCHLFSWLAFYGNERNDESEPQNMGHISFSVENFVYIETETGCKTWLKLLIFISSQ